MSYTSLPPPNMYWKVVVPLKATTCIMKALMRIASLAGLLLGLLTNNFLQRLAAGVGHSQPHRGCVALPTVARCVIVAVEAVGGREERPVPGARHRVG